MHAQRAHAQEWQGIERCYLDGFALGLSAIAEQHSVAVAHFDGLKQQFKALLARPDRRAALVTKFQQARASFTLCGRVFSLVCVDV